LEHQESTSSAGSTHSKQRGHHYHTKTFSADVTNKAAAGIAAAAMDVPSPNERKTSLPQFVAAATAAANKATVVATNSGPRKPSFMVGNLAHSFGVNDIRKTQS
jgi:hypothetical protein